MTYVMTTRMGSVVIKTKADSLEEAVRQHNEDGVADYEETEEIFSEINDEGTEEVV